MIPVLLFHGVGVTQPYAAEAERALGAGFGIIEGWWRSTGSRVADSLMMGVPSWRAKQVRRVADAMRAFRRTFKGGVVAGHSMGAALALSAAREARWESPIVLVGAPVTHPLARLWLAPLIKQGPCGVINLYNRDDGVTALSEALVLPSWMEHIPIALPGRDGVVGEHDLVDYLGHFRVRDAIRRAAAWRAGA